MSHIPQQNLRRNTNFRLLWAGQTVSVFGSMVGGFALSLVAVIVLHASAAQMMVLNAALLVPGLVAGPFIGVLVDRWPRRPLMITGDLGRALVLASLPLAAWLGRLSLWQVYIAALLVSVLTLLFDVSYRAYLPTLAPTDQLTEGNSALQASNAVAEVGGFGLGGILVQALTAPGAILVDAFSFIVSACCLFTIRTREAPAENAPGGSFDWSGMRRDLAAGIHFTWHHPLVRASAASSATINLCQEMLGVVFALYVVRQLHLTPVILGPLFALGGISSLVGALVAGRATARWGIGRSLIGSVLLRGASLLCIPLAGGPIWIVLILLAAQQLAGDGPATIYDIVDISLMQTVTPAALQGRVAASLAVLTGLSRLIGLLLGGVIGQTLGLRATLLVSGIGTLCAVFWLAMSPVRHLNVMPETDSTTGLGGVYGGTAAL